MPRSSKGSSFERWFCKELSKWWTNGQSDSVFWRTANSGGRATTRAKQGKKTKGHYGDVMAVDPIGQPFLDCFTIELKRGYNKFSIMDLLDAPKKSKPQKYEEWISKARAGAKEAGSETWLLVIKRDKREPIVIYAESIVPDDQTIMLFNGFALNTLENFFKSVKPKDFQ